MAPVSRGRTMAERIFLALFLPTVLAFYSIHKYPRQVLDFSGFPQADISLFHLAGKAPGFWYASIYTALVCGACLWLLRGGRNQHQTKRKKGAPSSYQRAKFRSIFLAQLIAFYLVPYVVPAMLRPEGFFHDPVAIGGKAAHVYVWPAFTSAGGAIYIFMVIPLAVWFFGKRYCSWFCSCGNLAEAVGVLPWGARWVRERTPRGTGARKLEVLQLVILLFSLFFGLMLLLDGLALVTADGLLASTAAAQDLVIDFAFGSVIGVGAYPLLGTRIWCRYGCPLAQGMKLVGAVTRSRFAVQPNDKCRGLNLCTAACPMGIDVASYAHRDKQPTEQAFGLWDTPCIGCGGCIESCPVDALAFAPLGGVPIAGESS